MTTEKSCPKCHLIFPTNVRLHGLCPRCLLSSGVEELNKQRAITSELPNIPGFEILACLGSGSSGIVYKAFQPALERFVALKVLTNGLTKKPDFVERLQREGQALAKLKHPNIISIYNVGEHDSISYLVLEYIDGKNLRQVLRSAKVSLVDAFQFAQQLSAGLAYAHENGILHRDIKPENILIKPDGRLLIGDFGLTKLLSEKSLNFSLTLSAESIGTPFYMAPEQLEGSKVVDKRADIYSMAVVIYEMITGDLPLGNFEPPSIKEPSIKSLDEPLLKALSRDPQRRFQDVEEFRQALLRAQQNLGCRRGIHSFFSNVIDRKVIGLALVLLMVVILPGFLISRASLSWLNTPTDREKTLIPFSFVAGVPNWAWARLPPHRRDLLLTPLTEGQGFAELLGKDYQYGELSLAGKKYPVLSSVAEGLIYVDSNGNKNLGDDGLPVHVHSEGSDDVMLVAELTFSLAYQEEEREIHEPLILKAKRSVDGQSLSFYPIGYRVGRLNVDRKEDDILNSTRTILVDTNVDGDFSNDPLIVDLNGNLQVEDEEIMPIKHGEERVIGGEVVTQILPSGRGVVVRRGE